jgi:hypothetical protein
VKKASQKTDLNRTDLAKDKTGAFTGAYAVNPANGAKVPVWVADYVLMTYGTGAIMAVPGHDERDHEFARVMKLPIVQVVQSPAPVDIEAAASVDDGVATAGSREGVDTAATAAPAGIADDGNELHEAEVGSGGGGGVAVAASAVPTSESNDLDAPTLRSPAPSPSPGRGPGPSTSFSRRQPCCHAAALVPPNAVSSAATLLCNEA